MDTLICRNCEAEYEPYSQRRPICPDCRRAYDREYHANLSKEKKLRKQQKQELRRKENIQWMREKKIKSGCVDCGITDHRVLQFDHLPEFDKHVTLANAGAWSRKRLREEIAKCEVVCANCHSIRTYENYFAVKALPIEAGVS